MALLFELGRVLLSGIRSILENNLTALVALTLEFLWNAQVAEVGAGVVVPHSGLPFPFPSRSIWFWVCPAGGGGGVRAGAGL